MSNDIENILKRLEILEEWMIFRESQHGGLLYKMFAKLKKAPTLESLIRGIGRGALTVEEIAQKLDWKLPSVRGRISELNNSANPLTLIESRKDTTSGKTVYFLTKAGLKVLEFLEGSDKTSSLVEYTGKEATEGMEDESRNREHQPGKN